MMMLRIGRRLDLGIDCKRYMETLSRCHTEIAKNETAGLILDD